MISMMILFMMIVIMDYFRVGTDLWFLLSGDQRILLWSITKKFWCCSWFISQWQAPPSSRGNITWSIISLTSSSSCCCRFVFKTSVRSWSTGVSMIFIWNLVVNTLTTEQGGSCPDMETWWDWLVCCNYYFKYFRTKNLKKTLDQDTWQEHKNICGTCLKILTIHSQQRWSMQLIM